MLLIDKPVGPTSREVAEACGRAFGVPRRRRGAPRFRVGHAGTLDPGATGLLLVLVGRATRLQPFLLGLDKTYTAVVRLGAETDTHDADGEVVARLPAPADPGDLAAVAARFRGETMQTPPVISALKRGGRSLHALARAGESPEPPAPRPVRIDALTLTAGRWGVAPRAGDPRDARHLAPDDLVYELRLHVACGSGTYVRALARDVARELGAVGHVAALRRERVGPFAVAAALDWPTSPEALREALLAPADALAHLPAYTLAADHVEALAHGQQPLPGWLDEPAPPLFRLLDDAGRLAAVGRRDPATGAPATAVVLATPSGSGEDDPCA
jgi:tRNA pseudouridine55 synthase